MTEPAMIISMPTIARSQQRYDHRLRNLVQRTGDVTVATNRAISADILHFPARVLVIRPATAMSKKRKGSKAPPESTSDIITSGVLAPMFDAVPI